MTCLNPNSSNQNDTLFQNIQIGFLGAGNMALAIATGFLKSGSSIDCKKFEFNIFPFTSTGCPPNAIHACAPSNNNLIKFKVLY